MIQNVIFDIGQVLVAFPWREFMMDLYHDEEMVKKVGDVTVASSMWKEVDRGLIPLSKLIERCVTENPEIAKEINQFFELKNEIATPFSFSVEWVKEVKSFDKKVYLLSNYSEESYLYLEERAEFPKYVDGKIISYSIKHIKPEPQIYQALIDTYSITPEESIFLDDVQENLNAAKELGFNTLLVKDPIKARKKLFELLT